MPDCVTALSIHFWNWTVPYGSWWKGTIRPVCRKHPYSHVMEKELLKLLKKESHEMPCMLTWRYKQRLFLSVHGSRSMRKRLRTYRQPALNTCKEHLWPKTYHKPEEAYYKLCNSIVTVSDESMTCLHFRQYLPLIHGVRNLLLQQVEAILRRNDMNNGRQLEPPGKTHQLGSPPCVKGKHSLNYRYWTLYTTIATVTINLIVAVAIILLNLYVAVSTGCRLPPLVLSMHFPDVAASIYVEAVPAVPHE